MTGEHEIKKNKNKKNIYFLRIQKRKRKQKQAQKGMDEMEWHKMDYLIFSAMRVRNANHFASVVTTTYRMKNNKS